MIHCAVRSSEFLSWQGPFTKMRLLNEGPVAPGFTVRGTVEVRDMWDLSSDR